MSEMDGTCEYVLDPDDPETWGGEEGDECYIDEEVLNEDGVWACPHDAAEGEGLCIFHLPVEEKDDEKVVDAFLNTLDKATASDDSVTQDRKLQFLRAQFGTFELEVGSEPLTKHGRLDLSYAVIDDVFDWSDIEFGGSVIFRSAEFRDEADFRHTEFQDEVVFSMSNFTGKADFGTAVFVGEVTFSETTFEDSAGFIEVEFRSEANFESVTFSSIIGFALVEFGSTVSFESAEFEGKTNFESVVFSEDVGFASTEFNDEANFKSAACRGPANFWSAEFESGVNFDSAEFERYAIFQLTVFESETNFESVKFGGGATFFQAAFENKVTFSQAEFGGNTEFHEAEFDEGVDFINTNLYATKFNKADLTDATFSDTDLCNANFESALLSRATLFGADLRGAKLSGAVLGDVRINEDTNFLGHPSDDSDTTPHTISGIRSRPTCVYDPLYEDDNEHADLDKAKSVYRALEELGSKHARPRLQERAFVRRQDLQKDEYKQHARSAESWEERFIAGARYARAKVARATLLYGESPWRVIAWSLGIIVSFALLYPLGGWMTEGADDTLSYSQIPVSFFSEPLGWLGGFGNVLGDSLYYSTLTYTALGFGDFQPVGLGRLLTTVETGLGAVMLALLVFILGRRAAR